MLGVRRKVVRSQLAMVFPQRPESAIMALTSGVYEQLGESLAETFCCAPGKLAARVRVEPGWDTLDEAVVAGRGVLVVTAHLGNFELGGRILAQRYPLLDVVKPMRNGMFDRYLRRERLRHGIHTVPMAASGRAVVSHLRAGGLVTLLVDQDAGRDGVRTDFLGVPASTWSGAARVAVRTGCAVVPLGMLRQPDGSHIVHLGPPLETKGVTMSATDISNFTARISAAVETFIWERPEQWFWVHRRWKGASEARVPDTEGT